MLPTQYCRHKSRNVCLPCVLSLSIAGVRRSVVCGWSTALHPLCGMLCGGLGARMCTHKTCLSLRTNARTLAHNARISWLLNDNCRKVFNYESFRADGLTTRSPVCEWCTQFVRPRVRALSRAMWLQKDDFELRSSVCVCDAHRVARWWWCVRCVCVCLRHSLRGFFGGEEHVFEAYCADSIISSIHG